jgi:hypothetical protein
MPRNVNGLILPIKAKKEFGDTGMAPSIPYCYLNSKIFSLTNLQIQYDDFNTFDNATTKKKSNNIMVANNK